MNRLKLNLCTHNLSRLLQPLAASILTLIFQNSVMILKYKALVLCICALSFKIQSSLVQYLANGEGIENNYPTHDIVGHLMLLRAFIAERI